MNNIKIKLPMNTKCARVKPMEKKPYESKWNTGNIDYTLENIKQGDNYVILTGKINNIIVIDIDVYKFGSFDTEQMQMFIDNQDTFMVKSARGGLHIYYEYEDKFSKWGSPTDIYGNMDLRSDKYGIVGPGSKTENGEYKIVCNKKPCKMPESWYNLIESQLSKINIHKKMTSNIDCSDSIIDQLKAKLDSMNYKITKIIIYKIWYEFYI